MRRCNEQVTSAPAEWQRPRPIGTFLDKWFVVLTTRPRVNLHPALLAVVLQACDAGAEERRKLAATASTLTLVTQLVIKNVRLHLHLNRRTTSASNCQAPMKNSPAPF